MLAGERVADFHAGGRAALSRPGRRSGAEGWRQGLRRPPAARQAGRRAATRLTRPPNARKAANEPPWVPYAASGSRGSFGGGSEVKAHGSVVSQFEFRCS